MVSGEQKAKVVVTGGAGFIGSNLVRMLVTRGDVAVVNLDKLTYAGNRESVIDLEELPGYRFVMADICDRDAVREIYARERPDAVMHLAAESHVDRSIADPDLFIRTNVFGTYTLLEEAQRYVGELDGARRERFRFLSVSTDEVYGSLGEDGAFSEASPYNPSSPYAASKAAADHLVRAYHRTYGLPVLITNCSNNYGPYQFPEKLIPLMITQALQGERLPVYGRGRNVRDWLYVEDHCEALWTVLREGVPGRTYNIGGNQERRNIDVVHAVCDLLQELRPVSAGYRDLVTFVRDRPGHDYRYAIDASRIRSELGWEAQHDFSSGLRRTIRWYLDNQQWVQRVTSGEYRKWMETNYGDRR